MNMDFDAFLEEVEDDELLKDVEPAGKARIPEDPAVQSFIRIQEFYEKHGRLPELDRGELERTMAVQLGCFRTRLRSRVEPHDKYGILDMAQGAACGDAVAHEMEAGPKTFEDILNSDDLGLIEDLSTDILVPRNVPFRESKVMPEEIAKRTPCEDFQFFEKTFNDIQDKINNKRVQIVRFTNESQVTVGCFYILKGVLCYVAEVLDDRADEVRKQVKNDVANPRFRVIFGNGVESNMLKRSLARALYADEHGRAILPLPEDVKLFRHAMGMKDLETGCIYILSSHTNAPALAEYKRRGQLLKIGFSTRNVEERIKNAANEPTYLEAPVKLEANIRCFNLDPHRVEKIIHAFLANQRINMTLYTRKGEPYRPEEWFAVDLQTALEVCQHVVDGDIMNYRMDNTTNRLKPV